jgi:hypothetical protein
VSTKELCLWVVGIVAWIVALVGVFAALLAVMFDDGDRCPLQGRMPSSCLTWVTVDRYERQFLEDLPIGTPRWQVEDYLRREGVAYVEEAPLRPGESRLRLVWSWKLLVGGSLGLEIQIVFNTDGAVAEIYYNKQVNTL